MTNYTPILAHRIMAQSRSNRRAEVPDLGSKFNKTFLKSPASSALTGMTAGLLVAIGISSIAIPAAFMLNKWYNVGMTERIEKDYQVMMSYDRNKEGTLDPDEYVAYLHGKYHSHKNK